MATRMTGVEPGDYINGHLPNLAYDFAKGRFLSGEEIFGWQGSLYTVHLDSLLLSLVLGLGVLLFLALVARRASQGVPGCLQGAVEMLVLFVRDLVHSLFPAAPRLIGPLALTVFTWVFFMNLMDLVPVDALNVLSQGHVHAKIVPTTDLNVTFGLALSVFLLVIYYNLKVKGLGGFLKEVCVAPFGPWLMPVNLLMRLIEELAKPLSLALRLFGNLFAAEMIFLLIALMPFWVQWLAGGPWAIYHILVVPLQAFIFTALTVVYVSLAHETHAH